MNGERLSYWVAPLLAGAGLAGLAAVFAVETASFRRAVVGWARRDLESRAALAAANLREPAATGDFRVLRAFGEDCAREGMRLTVTGPGGGLHFDSAGTEPPRADAIYATAPAGEYAVRLGLPLARVLAPVRRARIGFALAALAGGAGVLLVLLVTYRQRVKMDEMRKAEQFRRDFIADVSHELKTPLTGILGAADLLEEAPTPEMRAKLVALVKKESLRLNALAQDILALARLERGAGALNLAEADLGDVVSEACEALRPAFERAGVALAVACPPTPVRVRCDAALMARAVSNLVLNALRHSGSPEVAVAVSSAEGWVRVSVEDRGVGIPAELAGKVFERFYRLDASRASETGGSGLGLAIVRQIVRLHGGEVTLEGVAPHGCRFTLRLRGRCG